MNNKIFLMIMLILLLVLPMASAVDLFDFDNYDKFVPNDKYGEIEVWDEGIFLIGQDTKLSSSVLNYNSNTCLIDCNAQPTITLFEDGELIEDIRYLDTEGKEVELPTEIVYYIEEEYEFTIPDIENSYEICSLDKNGTSVCDINNVYKTETRTRRVGVNYEVGDSVQAGTYEVEINAKKGISQSVDWQIKVKGEWHEAWAWWNTDFAYKQKVSFTGDVSDENVTSFHLIKTANMNSTYNIRIVDDTETTEIPYFIDSINGTGADLTIRHSDNDDIYLYYGDESIANSSDRGAVYSDDIITIDNGETITTGGEAKTPAQGYKINSNSNKNFKVVQMTVSSTATGLSRVMCSSNYGEENITNSGTITNLIGNLTVPCDISPNKNYYILADNSGASYSQRYDGSVTYPIAANPYNIVAGALDTGDNAGILMNIESMGILFKNDVTYTIGAEVQGSVTATISSPEDAYNSTTDTLDLACNFTAISYSNISNVSVFVYDSSNNLDYTNVDTSIGVTTRSYNKTWTTSALDDGTYSWNCSGISFNNDEGYSSTRTFTIDEDPPSLNIIFPTGDVTDGVVTSNDRSVAINWTTVESSLDTCWYYNQTANVTVTCGNNATLTLPYGTYTHRVYANDSLGNIGSDNITTTYGYVILENSQTYNTTTIETAEENFLINISYVESEWTGVSANLLYNGTSYAGIQSGTGDDIVFSRTIDIPDILSGGQENKSFYWEFVFTNITGVNYLNSSSNNQTVNIISFTNCNSGAMFINFSTKEFLPTTYPIKNATFEGTFELKYQGGESGFQNFTFSDLTEQNNSWGFCLSPPENDYILSATIEYDATGYAQNYYYLNDFSISNTTTQVDLYLLNDSSATATILRVIDTAQAPVSDVLITIQSYDVGTDTYYTTAMAKSSSGGEDLAYLNWYDTFYKFILVQDGTTKLTTSGYKITETPQILQIPEESVYTFSKFNNFDYSLYYNENTSNFVLTYIKPSGDVDTGCLRVIKRNATAEDTICQQCETSSSATIYCNVGSSGNGTFIAEFYATGSYKLISMISELIGEGNEIYEELGYKEATTYALLFGGIVMSMFLFSPVLAIIGLIMGMFLGMLMGFQALHYSEFIGIVVVGGLIIWLLKR